MTEQRYQIYAPESWSWLDGRTYVEKPCHECSWIDITTMGMLPHRQYIVGAPCPEHIRQMPDEYR